MEVVQQLLFHSQLLIDLLYVMVCLILGIHFVLRLLLLPRLLLLLSDILCILTDPWDHGIIVHVDLLRFEKCQVQILIAQFKRFDVGDFIDDIETDPAIFLFQSLDLHVLIAPGILEEVLDPFLSQVEGFRTLEAAAAVLGLLISV